MANFVGLEGIEGGRAQSDGFVHSVTGALKGLRKARVVSGAGDYGSFTVWIADDGKYHCDLSQFRVTQNKQIFTTKSGVKEWLQFWLPRCYESNTGTSQ